MAASVGASSSTGGTRPSSVTTKGCSATSYASGALPSFTDGKASRQHFESLKEKYRARPYTPTMSPHSTNAVDIEYRTADKQWSGWHGNNIDHCTAVRVFHRLAKAGHLPSIHRLGEVWSTGKGTDVLVNPLLSKVISEPWDDMKWTRVTDHISRGNTLPEGMDEDHETNHWFQPATIDMKQAFEWYSRAAALGYPPSEFELGMLYCDGKGCAKDMERSIEYFELSASHDYPRGLNALAVSFSIGDGYEQNYELALGYYQLAIEYDSVRAMSNMAAGYTVCHQITSLLTS